MRRLSCLLAALSLAVAAPPAGAAESVLDRVARTGVLDAGTRADAIPMAFRGEDGGLIGLSVDLLREITAHLGTELGRPVKLNLIAVTSANRIDLVEAGTLAIECGITTPTWTREKRVDFSLPFFENGTRILTFRQAARTLEDLHGKRIGALKGGTTAGIVAAAVPTAVIVDVDSMTQGMDRLVDGELDGLANIGIVLRAQIEELQVKSRMVLLPRTGALSYESIACVLPQDDSRWRDFVNGVIARLLEGIVDFRGAYFDIYERWLGASGSLYFPLDRETAQRLASNLIWLD